MFVDYVKIQVKAGDGGNGCVTFRREKFVPRGGPDGGDGGKGGNVVLTADPHLVTLYDLRLRVHLTAGQGANGSGNKRRGKNGQEVIVAVPMGTVVREGDQILADLSHPGQSFVVAKGGNGGWGNARFATSTNRTPYRANPGQEGEERTVELELKLIADVGLVGRPNAGKSTILTRLTAATPKIAPYPFTTREPNLGVMYRDIERHATLADIPGLIEGAHMGLGLGDRFLRHIERTRILVHVVGISNEGDDRLERAWKDYETVRGEIASYSERLAAKPEIVTINKMDLVASRKELEAIAASFREAGKDPVLISALEEKGLDVLSARIFELLERIEPEGASVPESGYGGAASSEEEAAPEDEEE